jgi:hypothetical protein
MPTFAPELQAAQGDAELERPFEVRVRLAARACEDHGTLS